MITKTFNSFVLLFKVLKLKFNDENNGEKQPRGTFEFRDINCMLLFSNLID